MTGLTFDANIIIDALSDYPPAQAEIRRAMQIHSRAWISRMVWIEVLSKGPAQLLARARLFLTGFDIDEVDIEVAEKAAALRRDRTRLKSPDAIILASAQLRGRVLVTRNTKDFPATMPGIRVPYVL